jgi:hypothetical protein
MVYGDDGQWKHVPPNIVSMPDGSADAILNEVRSAIDNKTAKWTTKRHEHYPTRDIPVGADTLPTTSTIATDLLNNVLAPAFEKNYVGVAQQDLTFQESFVIRYGTEPGGQRSLDAHLDGSPLSFVCALNDAYEGGGTHFTEIDTTCKPKKGQCCIFAGGVQKHQGVAITSGERYLLTGFVNFGPSELECEHLKSVVQ